MSTFFIKNLNKILFLFCFLGCLPLTAQAGICESNEGQCTPIETCPTSLSGGLYDQECIGMNVCCDPAIITIPPTATEYQEGATGDFLLLKGHIVPCGRKTDDPGTTTIKETDECTLCHLFLMLKNVFDLILSLLIIVSILLITIGGVVYIVSTGNSNLTGIAKNIITKTLIGFAVMLISWLLVFTLLTFLSTGDMVGKDADHWFEFTCDSNSRFN